MQMALTTNDPKVPQTVKDASEAALGQIAGIGRITVRIDIHAPAQTPGGAPMAAAAIEGVRHVIAVASGKGGVGKSTVATNLAMALQKNGASVGLCDCDLYGPSIGLMFGTNERPMATEDQRILPIEREDLKLMSMGFLLDDAAPAILRGPMVTKYTQQFLRQVEWGELDLPHPRSAAGHRRYPADHRPDRRAGRRDHRHHAAGSGADRCAQGGDDVSKGERPGARARGKHELLPLPQRRRALRHLRRRRRRARSGTAESAAARQDPDRYSPRAKPATAACRSPRSMHQPCSEAFLQIARRFRRIWDRMAQRTLVSLRVGQKR